MTAETELLNYKQAATYLGVSARFLRRLVDAGEVPVHRLGRAVRFSRAALDELITRSASEPVGGRHG